MKPTPLAILFLLMFGALVIMQNIDAHQSPQDTMQGPAEVEVVEADPLQITQVPVENTPSFTRTR